MSDKIKVDINIKSFKIGRVLEVLLTEALSDFERKHPRILPALKRGFRNGDPRTSLEKVEELQKLLDQFRDDISEIERLTRNYLSRDLALEEGKAVGPFLNPEGDTTYSMKDNEEVVLGPGAQKKNPPAKKKPAKKRATKKKAKKEE